MASLQPLVQSYPPLACTYPVGDRTFLLTEIRGEWEDQADAGTVGYADIAEIIAYTFTVGGNRVL